ncbi:Hydrogenase maturation protein HypF [Shewanella piezotolerans WP3]|uniref:Carbamoyltransferase HypF n=1 Tax=Shewanella piezotolerans (strain WP3 / JCM 13877) TaxID=225849 RepID=B8CMI9_SHEPW|nr:carbamoyltransferase HypF [Shewanella piezotolerans]ACJ29379.1 Hydrogenase maturation protein HypF [Shewanella piezotolerans WP3]
MTMALTRVEIKITGIVQGVGFRPFVYRLAHDLALSGSVLNNSEGVTIEAQASEYTIEQFKLLLTSPPPLARIDSFETKQIPVEKAQEQFCIIHSQNNADAIVAVSADKCTCADCFADISNPKSRYFRYPFTNCTNCGPRYTIINNLPYDRVNTSMATFVMCTTCEKEYQDPLNRRYHAQPVSCPNCGPQLSFRNLNLSITSSESDPLVQAIEAIKSGKILAIKGLGGFHLVCDATNHDSVKALRQRKNRPAKPLAIMVENSQVAKKLVTGNDTEWQTLNSNERPITVMQKRQKPELEISSIIAPDIDRLGVFLPYTPLHQMLMERVARPLVMTSANLSGEPIITASEDIVSKLGHIVDHILDHNRPILNGCDDSVVQVINNRLQILRLARGYAPLSIYSPQHIEKPTLGLGAQQKNTLCFAFGHNLFLSPHIGDLVSVEAERYFHDTLSTFSRLYHFEAKLLVHDRHPNYFTSQWAADEEEAFKTEVQHHYAHVLSVLAENKTTEQVLAFTFDGTGLGEDHTLWGGEVLLADAYKFERIAHLTPFKLIGGEQAIKQPVRLLISILLEKYSPEEIAAMKLPAIDNLSRTHLSNLCKVWHKTSPNSQTSSIGRLFDVVAVLLNLVDIIQYEGQAGILLETAANSVIPSDDMNNYHGKAKEDLKANNIEIQCDFKLHLTERNQWQPIELIEQILTEIHKMPLTTDRVNFIARAFMDCIANMVCDIALGFKSTPIVLTGGVFQNRYLLERCERQLTAQANKIMQPKFVPINDAGIALGQAWFAINNNIETTIDNICNPPPQM